MSRKRPDEQRVVITGLGAITPLALTVPETWEGLIAGKSGVAHITQFDASEFPVRIAAEVKGFDPRNYMDFKEARRMARCSQLAIAAAQEAVADAQLPQPFVDEERVGVLIGSTIGGFEKAVESIDTFREKGLARVSPFGLTASVPNMPSHHVSQAFQAKGYSNTVTTACATGTQAVGEAAEVIRRGAADVLICGGVEAVIHFANFVGFIAMRAISARNDEPERASRPFDKDRDGFVIGEGCGLMVLESLPHALQRGAHIYAEVLGYSASSDAFHVAAPDPEGAGAVRAMRWALQDAGIAPTEVGYINAHGTSTPLNDVIETNAIKKVFGEYAYRVSVSSTKSMLGHDMAAAGAIEAVVCALTIEQGIIHPTTNYETPDPECDLDYVPNQARQAEVNIALSNSFGLGGQNACLVLGRYVA